MDLQPREPWRGAGLASSLRYLREERGKDLGSITLQTSPHLEMRTGEHELFPFIQDQRCDAARGTCTVMPLLGKERG